MPTALLQDKDFLSWIEEEGMHLYESLNSAPRTERRNPQTLFKAFKDLLCNVARERVKQNVPKIDRRIDRLKADLHAVLAGDPDATTEQIKAHQAAILQD